MKERQCKFCKRPFEPKTVNSVYCRQECQRAAAKKRYYDGKKRLTTKRTCEWKKCKTILSIYNKEEICEAHKEERLTLRLVSWGWDEDKLRRENKR
jgi:hypothetical protein